jgi:hypothetical protein
MWKLGVLAAVLMACNQPDQRPARADDSAPEAKITEPQTQADCSAQEAKIAELQARIDELTKATARSAVAPAHSTFGARPNPWAVQVEENSDGHTRVLLINKPARDDSVASLAILCQNGSFTISFRPAGGRRIPAGRYNLNLRFGGFGDGSYQTLREVNLPEESDTLVLNEAAMEGIRTRPSLSISATATGEPQDIPHAIFSLGGIEEHLKNPTYAQACGLQ